MFIFSYGNTFIHDIYLVEIETLRSDHLGLFVLVTVNFEGK